MVRADMKSICLAFVWCAVWIPTPALGQETQDTDRSKNEAPPTVEAPPTEAPPTGETPEDPSTGDAPEDAPSDGASPDNPSSGSAPSEDPSTSDGSTDSEDTAASASGDTAANDRPSIDVDEILSDPELTAVRAEQLGNAFFKDNELRAAEKSFQRAIELGGPPALWLAVGEARERQGLPKPAAEALQTYLTEVPEARDRPAVEARLEGLREAAALEKIPADAPDVDDPNAGVAEPTLTENDDAAPAEVDEPRIRTAVWATGAVGAAALVTGTVLGFLALQEEDDFRNNPTLASADRGDRLSIVADFSFGIAAASGITALVLYLTHHKKKRTTRSMVPDIGPGHAGLVGRIEF